MRKVALLGGSSAFTPALVRDLAAAGPPPIELHLWGRSPRRLALARRACVQFGGEAPLDVRSSTRLDEALEGAELVLQQVRVGGAAARDHDESFPVPSGIPGDEGIGPSGLAAAIRSGPVLRRMAGRIRARAPKAVVLNLTAPLGPTTACLREEGLEAWGVCELPKTTLARIDEAIPGRGPFAYAGVNHQGFFHSLRDGSGDRTREAFEAAAAEFPPSVFARYEAVPLRPMRLLLDTRRVVAEQRAALTTRARELFALASRVFDEIEAGDWERAAGAIAARPTPWTAGGVVPLLLDLLDGGGDLHFLTVPAGPSSFIPGALLEQPCRIERGAPVPLATRSPPSEVATLIERLVAFERLAVAAVGDPSAANVERALLAHPLVRGRRIARALVPRVLEPVEAWEPRSPGRVEP
ncbi:MAG TPA: hypothetical protein VFI25_00790 [Planctomycetota bacterium]|jgi:6-phospho-beta-glucosidase|nr:hypothetical protein [Planctomycetota bacterium]